MRSALTSCIKRRRKQREFAKMRKALLEDESLGKIGMLTQY